MHACIGDVVTSTLLTAALYCRQAASLSCCSSRRNTSSELGKISNTTRKAWESAKIVESFLRGFRSITWNSTHIPVTNTVCTIFI